MAAPKSKSAGKSAAKHPRRSGSFTHRPKPGPARRERMNLMVDRALLDRVAAGFGTTNKSDAVHRALSRAAEDAAIVAGVDALFGAIPDFPLDDRP